MALGIPPWLEASPALYQRAIEAGAQTGLRMASLADASREGALDRAARQSALDAQLAERSRDADLDRALRESALAQQLAIEQQRGERLDTNAERNYSLREAQNALAREKMGNLEDYRGERLGQAADALAFRRESAGPEAYTARAEASDKIRRRKEIDTFRAGAAGALEMLARLKPTDDPALRQKYTAAAANFEAKAKALEAMLEGGPEETGQGQLTPPPSTVGELRRYVPGQNGARGTLQILQR